MMLSLRLCQTSTASLELEAIDMTTINCSPASSGGQNFLLILAGDPIS
jgi:hypothetical protein